MKFKLSKEIKTGLLGVIALAMFIFGYNYLKGTGLFSSTKIIKSEYDNEQGLTASSYVQLQGFNIGAVKLISLSEKHPGKITVEMTIDKDLEIPIDSKVKIVSLDLLGTKAVSLIKGKSTTMIKDNDFLAGEIELGTIDALGAAATPAIENINNIISTLDTTIHNINNILDVTTQNNLKTSIANLNKTLADFSQFSNELNAQRSKLTGTLNNLNAFSTNLNNNNATITKVLSNAETTTNNLSKINFESTVNDIKKTLGDLQTTINKVNNGNGSLAMLMNDDKLYKNLKNTLSTANNLLYDINARPSRYINVNIFGKKQKNECPPLPAPNAND